jgi:virginiamycin B lyase
MRNFVKKQTKGIFAFLFLGGIMVTSGVVIAFPGVDPGTGDPEITMTGTPADNYPDEQRAQFCGSSNAKSTDYVREFSIPTLCTNPLAIDTDYDGNVWFAETNTGKIAKFDPITATRWPFHDVGN